VEEAQSAGAMVAVTLDSINTTGMNNKALAEAELSIQIYSDFFGPSSFKRISMTQQTAMNFGQAWPELVYMPLSSYLDGTVRHQLMGFDPYGYFKVVGPHEVAHQWWGHTVGWNSYRDQWMSEGFSEFSASLFLQRVYGNKAFLDFWEDEHKLLTEKNNFGYRAIDVGPVTMGYRLSNAKSGYDISRRLIYPKGGYILHMLRMMMWTGQKQDEGFKAMMKEFVTNYRDHAASTEDFKATVERHMTPQMDIDGTGKMDWFFNQYVYGTSLPSYKFTHGIDNGPDGPVLNFRITQSNVDPNFKMLVPIYLDMGGDRIRRLGSATLVGNSVFEQKIPLKGLKELPKRAMINYYADVLCLTEK
jgi:hypothetical protein